LRKVTTSPREQIWEISTLGPARWARQAWPGWACRATYTKMTRPARWCAGTNPIRPGTLGLHGWACRAAHMNYGAARRVVCGNQSNPARHARPGWACRAAYMNHGAARRVVCRNQSNPARHDMALHLPARPGKSAYGSVRHCLWFGMWRMVIEERRK
jgi:hypothetical protein